MVTKLFTEETKRSIVNKCWTGKSLSGISNQLIIDCIIRYRKAMSNNTKSRCPMQTSYIQGNHLWSCWDGQLTTLGHHIDFGSVQHSLPSDIRTITFVIQTDRIMCANINKPFYNIHSTTTTTPPPPTPPHAPTLKENNSIPEGTVFLNPAKHLLCKVIEKL